MTPAMLTGIPASPGIVVGPVHILRWEVPEVPQRVIDESAVPRELERLRHAFDKAVERLRILRERAERQAGPAEAAIFDVQVSIIEDADLRRRVEDVIRQNFAAERAFDVVMLEYRDHFARSAHAMMRERVGDLLDVHIRVLSILLDLPAYDPVDLPKGSNSILVTHDLTPSLTLQLDRESIAGIATDAGTRTSHVAILARSLGLPAVVGLLDATSRLTSGEKVILDATAGVLVVRPTAGELKDAAARANSERREEKVLARLTGQESDHRGRCADQIARERGPAGRGRRRRLERGRGRRADAHRIPRRWPRHHAGRGRAVPGLHECHRRLRREARRDPHVRRRRRQASGRRISARAESRFSDGARSACAWTSRRSSGPSCAP